MAEKVRDMEIWARQWCPHCNHINWFCDGNPDDDTRYGANVEAIECCHCKKRYWIVDCEDTQWGFMLEEYEDDEGIIRDPVTSEFILNELAFCEEGRKSPL